MQKTPEQKELAKLIGKLLRDTFGRGPEFIDVSFSNHYICFYLKNFITPVEKILMRTKNEDIVIKTRDALIDSVSPEIKAYIKIVTGQDVEEFYYDWSLLNQSGYLLCISSKPITISNQQLIDFDYLGKQKLHEKIFHINKRVGKFPEEISSFLIDSRHLVITRERILVDIERELIRMGHIDQLKRVKRKLEKQYYHINNHLESIIQTKIIDCFIVFNFEKEKMHIIFFINFSTHSA